MDTNIRGQLISAGVKNLRQFGYPACDDANILTDPIFSAFFKGMLDDNLGRGADAEINSLLAEIADAVIDKAKDAAKEAAK